jgi:hypothetical protein
MTVRTTDGDDVTMKHVKQFLKVWADLVKSRDGWKCQHCGSPRRLNAHHVEMKSKRPDLIFEISNGITLCKPCHMKEHRKMARQSKNTSPKPSKMARIRSKSDAKRISKSSPTNRKNP